MRTQFLSIEQFLFTLAWKTKMLVIILLEKETKEDKIIMVTAYFEWLKAFFGAH